VPWNIKVSDTDEPEFVRTITYSPSSLESWILPTGMGLLLIYHWNQDDQPYYHLVTLLVRMKFFQMF
jgi:hypothetical protein